MSVPCQRRLVALLLCLAPAVSAMPPLTEQPGDPQRGRAVVLDRDRGHCLLCHRIDQLDEGFQGTIGPPLAEVGRRLSPAELRERLVDPTRLNPATVMPAYYRVNDLRQVADAYRGQTILSAQEVEDVVAFLTTLTDPGGRGDGARDGDTDGGTSAGDR